MSGLLLKDFLVLRKQSKIMVAMLVFYAFFSFYNQNISMFAYISVLFAFFLPMNSLSYDDRCNWNKYALCTRVKPSMIVYSKYILSLLGVVMACLCSVILAFIIQKGFHRESLQMILYSLYLGIAFTSIYLPFCFKFGVEKSRYIIIAICMTPSLIVVALSKAQVLHDPSPDTIHLLFQLAPIIIVASALISIRLSIGIMNKKEY